jgi:hypothetical protein
MEEERFGGECRHGPLLSARVAWASAWVEQRNATFLSRDMLTRSEPLLLFVQVPPTPLCLCTLPQSPAPLPNPRPPPSLAVDTAEEAELDSSPPATATGLKVGQTQP